MKLQGIFIHKGGYRRPARWVNELFNVLVAALLGMKEKKRVQRRKTERDKNRHNCN